MVWEMFREWWTKSMETLRDQAPRNALSFLSINSLLDSEGEFQQSFCVLLSFHSENYCTFFYYEHLKEEKNTEFQKLPSFSSDWSK